MSPTRVITGTIMFAVIYLAIGAIVGAVLSIPAGVFVVYRRYRGYFT